MASTRGEAWRGARAIMSSPMFALMNAVQWVGWFCIRRILMLDEYVFNLAFDLGSFVSGKTLRAAKQFASIPLHIVHSAVEVVTFSLLIGYPAYRSSQMLYESDAPLICKNIQYGDRAAQRVDLYLVPEITRPAPVLLFVQGGGWTICRKDFYPSLGRALRKQGIMTAVCDYTAFPRGTMKTMEDDVRACIAWIVAHAAEYGGDPERIYLCGQSAGAHLCALTLVRDLALLPSVPLPTRSPMGSKSRSSPSLSSMETCGPRGVSNGLASLGVRHFIGVSGPYDVPALHRHFAGKGKDTLANLAEIFDGRENYEHYSPLHLLQKTVAAHNGNGSGAVAGALPPVTLIYATRDKTITLESTLAFDTALRQLAVPGRVIMYDEQSHLEPLMEILEGFENARLVVDIVRIIHGSSGSKPVVSEAVDALVVNKSWSWRLRSHVMHNLCPV